MNFRDFNQQLLKTAKLLQDNEKFLTGHLAIKAKKLAELYPYDNTVKDMYNYLSQKSQKVSMISRKELKDTYDKLYTSNNKFAGAFESELGIQKTAEVVKKSANDKDLLKEAQEKYSDSFLKNALESVFDAKKPVKEYSDQSAQFALNSTAFELSKIHCKPSRLEVVAGNENHIICRAGFDSPKGEVSVLIPVKLAKNNAYFPNSFINSEGLVQLTQENLTNHVVASAGKTLKVNASALLQGLTQASNPLSTLESAVYRMKTANVTAPVINHLGIVYQDAFIKEAKPLPETKYEVPEALKPFAEKLGTKVGEAEFIFGKKAVESGRNFIIQSLSSFGLKQTQVNVANLEQDKIIFAVSVNNKGFKVPVKIANGLALAPKFVIANGSLKEFSVKGLNEIFNSETDSNSLLASSILSEASLPELNKKLQNALYEGQHKVAEEILHILHQKDNAAFALGFDMYKKALAGVTIEKVASCGCNRTYRSQNSVNIICGHTNLPVNKVYQDKYGQCRPLYRRGLEDAPTSTMLDTKVFWS